MPDHAESRAGIVDALRRELVGPDPVGPEIDVEGEIEFKDYNEAYGPWRQRGSAEEILTRDYPAKRYGIGVLFPLRVSLEEGPARDGGVGEMAEGGAVRDHMVPPVGPRPEEGAEAPEIEVLG